MLALFKRKTRGQKIHPSFSLFLPPRTDCSNHGARKMMMMMMRPGKVKSWLFMLFLFRQVPSSALYLHCLVVRNKKRRIGRGRSAAVHQLCRIAMITGALDPSRFFTWRSQWATPPVSLLASATTTMTVAIFTIHQNGKRRGKRRGN